MLSASTQVAQAGSKTADEASALPKVMGILNITPDSFSDGNRFTTIDAALKHAESMLLAGAQIIDVGGESTRPGAAEVSAEAELERVIPVVQALSQQLGAKVSIDTSKPSVMRAAVDAGACMINDVYALQKTGALKMACALGVPVCLMHMQGTPKTMQQQPKYTQVVQVVFRFLHDRMQACLDAGLSQENLIVDPGFGFGKTLQHNLLLLQNLDQLCALGAPVLVGMSRKRMLGEVTNAPLDQRVNGHSALAAIAVMQGASIIRTHDVQPTVEAVKLAYAVMCAPPDGE